MNWLILSIFGIAAAALIIFIIRRNLKDKKEFEQKIQHDYRKPINDKGDIEADEVLH